MDGWKYSYLIGKYSSLRVLVSCAGRGEIEKKRKAASVDAAAAAANNACLIANEARRRLVNIRHSNIGGTKMRYDSLRTMSRNWMMGRCNRGRDECQYQGISLACVRFFFHLDGFTARKTRDEGRSNCHQREGRGCVGRARAVQIVTDSYRYRYKGSWRCIE